MRIDNPTVEGALTLPADAGASGSFSGSFEGDGASLTGIVATDLDIDAFGDDLTGATLAGTDKLILSDGGTEGRVNISQFATPLAGTGLEANSGTVRIATAAAGDGLSGGGGSALAVNVDDSTIETNADTLRVKDSGITNAKLANDGITIAGVDTSLGGTITADTIAGAISNDTITNAQLANDGITFGATSQALGSTITTISGLTLISADTGTFVHQIFESASTIVTSGSNVFGNDAADTQQITGSLLLSGSIVATAVGATINGAAIVTGSAQINHDSTTGFVANEHIDHSTVSITAGNGLTGGGTIAATRTLNIGAGTGITVNADSVQISDNGVGATQLNVAGNGSNGQYLGSDGDGSFTWTSVPAGYSVANSSNNRILTSVDSTNGNAEANLTFDGSTLTVAGTINETSARRFKENIVSLEDSLSKTLQLNPVEYDWIKDGKHDIGLIAEEVNEILPGLVHKEDGEIQGIHYSRLTAILIGAVKELTARVVELENK